MDREYYNPATYSSNRNPSKASGEPGPEKRSSATTSRSSESSYARSIGSGISHDTERRASGESKPRLSKEQQDILERHFQAQPKPSTITKKGFADNLGVPLDKINNWFQNRRAKVKQDAKKHHAAQEKQELHGSHQQHQHLFEPSFMSTSHSLDDASFVDPAFYNTITNMLDQMPEPVLALHHGALAHGELVQPFHGSHNFHARHFSNPVSLEQGTLIGEPMLDDSPEVFNQFFGLDDMVPGMTHEVDSNALWAFSKQFNPYLEGYNGVTGHIRDMETCNTSTTGSVMTRGSNDNSTTQLHRINVEDQPPPLSSSKPRSPTKGAPRSRLSDVQEHTMTEAGETSGEGMLVHDTTHMDQFVAMQQPQEQLPLRPFPQTYPAQQLHYPHMYHPDLRQIPILPSQQFPEPPTQPGGPDVQSRPWPPRPPAQFVHTNGEPMETEQAQRPEDMQESPSQGQQQHEPTLKTPKAASNLALRRQRRPAALGPSALRSASHSNAVPSPSKAVYPASATDATLRRIKSSTGVLNGRIQKSGPSSAPRSPMNISFADVPASPKFGRKISTSSLNAAANEQPRGTAAPMTPQSPREASRLPRSMSHSNNSAAHITISENEAEDSNSVWANMPTTADTGSMSVWSFMPHTSDTIPSYASPPTSPMDPGPFLQMSIQQGLYHHFPVPVQVPHSAPAWQQSFQLPPESHYVPQQHYTPMAGGQHDAMHFYGAPDGPAATTQAGYQADRRPGETPANEAHEAVRSMSDFQAPPETASRQSSQQLMGPPPQPVSTPQASQQFEPGPGPGPGPAQLVRSPPEQHVPQSPTMLHEYQPQMAPPPPPAAQASSAASPPVASPPTAPPLQRTPSNPIIQHEFPKSKTASPQQTSRSPSVGPRKPSGELFIHEYSPREPADPSRLPPKSRASQPREYHFTNHGPEYFSSP